MPPAIQEAIEDDSNDEEVTQPTPEATSKLLSPKVKTAAERSAKLKCLSGTVQQLFSEEAASKDDTQTSAMQPLTIITLKAQDAVITKLTGGNKTGLEYSKGTNSRPIFFIGDDGKTEYFSSVTAYAKKLGSTKHRTLGQKKLAKRGQVMKTTLSSNSKGYSGVLVTTDKQTLERLGVKNVTSGQTGKVIRGLIERLQELSVPSAPSPTVKAAIAKSRKSFKKTVKIGDSS